MCISIILLLCPLSAALWRTCLSALDRTCCVENVLILVYIFGYDANIILSLNVTLTSLVFPFQCSIVSASVSRSGKSGSSQSSDAGSKPDDIAKAESSTDSPKPDPRKRTRQSLQSPQTDSASTPSSAKRSRRI